MSLQAQRLKKLSQEGKLDDDTMLGIMMEQKKPETWDLKLPMDKIRKYFPRSYTPQRMEETIIKLLDMWHARTLISIAKCIWLRFHMNKSHSAAK